MQLNTPYRSEWEVEETLSFEEICFILSQPFTYLDRGAQCYVFASLDGKYVIKFFRFDCALVNKKTKKALADTKVESLFRASLLAYEMAKEETAVLYLHLNQTDRKYPIFHAKGPLGQRLSLNLNQYRFAIQKRGESFSESLQRAYVSKNPDAMKKRIDSFLAILHSRVSKGICNSDPSITRNFGFLGETAFEIDFGNYFPASIPKEKEIGRYTKRFRKWLVENAPEWVSYFDEQVSHDR